MLAASLNAFFCASPIYGSAEDFTFLLNFTPCEGLTPAAKQQIGETRKKCNSDDRRQWRNQGGAVGAAASRMRATAKQTLGAATRAVASLAMTERARPQKNGRCTAIGSGLCQSKTLIALPCSISASLPSQALTRQLSQRESLFKMRFPCWKPPAPLLHRSRRKRCSRLRPPKRLRRSRRRCQRRSRRPRW